MKVLLSIGLTACAALAISPSSLAGVNYIWNSSLENGPGPGGANDALALDWTFFGPTVERSQQENDEPAGGAWSLKAFGSETTVGAYQDVAVTAGDDVVISARLYTRGDDKVGGDAEAKIKLEFLDAAEQTVGTPTELTVLDASSTPDVWTPASIGPITAPAGAVTARMVCVWTYVDVSFGSAYWDDSQLSVNAGGNVLSNGDFELPGAGSGSNPFGIDHWIGFGGQQKSTDVAFHAQHSVRLQGGGEGGAAFSGLYQDFGEFGAGDHLFLNAYIYNPSAGGLTGSSAAAIKLEFFPTQGGNEPPPEEALDFDENADTDTWVLVSYTTTVPADITLARIVLIANDTSADNGPVYMDSAFAERGSQPAVNQLLNASFEQGTSGANGLTDWTEFRGFGCQARKNAFEIPAHDEFSVLKIGGDCVAGIYQDVEVQPGETLTVSVFAYSNSADPFNDPLATAGVKIEWRSGLVPPQIDIGGAPNNTATSASPTDEWFPLFIDYTMPPGTAALARFTVILAKGDAESVVVYFDLCTTGRVETTGPVGPRAGVPSRFPP